MGIWNVGLQFKITGFEEYLEVYISSLQETETYKNPDPKDNSQRILLAKSSSSSHLGFGFLVKNCLALTEKGQIDERREYIFASN